MPDPIPEVIAPTWWTEEIVQWAEASGRWPVENEPPVIFLTRLGLGPKSKAPQPADVVSPDAVVSRTTNPNIPAVVFETAA